MSLYSAKIEYPITEYIDYIQEQTQDVGLTSLVVEIIRRESNGWPNAKNPNSTAHGICQILRGTWEQFARPDEKRDDLFDQIDVCLRILDGGKGLIHWRASFPML